jgi:hypothetical protein
MAEEVAITVQPNASAPRCDQDLLMAGGLAIDG